MAKLIREKLDFSFNIKDFDLITEMLEQYLSDRIDIYNAVFLTEDYTKQDILQYIHFFICPHIADKKYHEYIERINHFLQREYEVFTLPEIGDLIYELQSIFLMTVEDYEAIEDFEEYEYNCIDRIYELWSLLYEQVINYPLLMLDDYEYVVYDYVPVYYAPNTQEFVRNTLKMFIQTMKKEFPESMRRLDSIIVCDRSYIEFVAGEGTEAYFIGDSLFMPSTVDEDQQDFYTETLTHEAGHFIFDLIPEMYQILWYDAYETWCNNGVKLTRETGKNEVQELFADAFSIVYSPVNDFIEMPSTLVIDMFKDIIKKSFTK